MSMASLRARIVRAPALFDAARAERVLTGLAIPASDPGLPLLRGAAGNSPFLARLMLKEPAFVETILSEAPEDVVGGVSATLLALRAQDRTQMSSALRVAKRRAALLIALCDLGGAWPLNTVCRALTEFADSALLASLRYCLREHAAQGRWLVSDDSAPEAGSGLFFLGMGKYGARELNYSSDIDFGCYYDPVTLPVASGLEPGPFAVRLTQSVVSLMQDITPDGYVFRCDLRMRPDAGSTQVAISIEAAEHYYEAMGQNWERAAMIKARPCAGDLVAGEAYLKRLAPFVWRKYLDFAAIEDIHSIKRQIHAHGNFGNIHVAGQNIKLGRGGIREIEFFAQTQQLILGGRDPGLRSNRTCEALDALTQRGVVDPAVNGELQAAYEFLRALEHRLQMIEDEQTHSLPKSSEGVDNAARFMGYEETIDFERDLIGHLSRVQGHYARLFEKSAPLSEGAGNLVFTGVEDDEGTIATLAGMGFSQPRGVAASIRGWHHGRIRATRSSRARERLTALTPLLLKALCDSGNPDLAFSRFDRFLSGLPSGVQVFELLFNNQHLLRFIADIVGTAPRLADHLARRPAMFEGLTDPGFLKRTLGADELRKGLEQACKLEEGFEGQLNACRHWAHDEQFRTGLELLQGALTGAQAGTSFTAIADTVIERLYAVCKAETEAAHGVLPDGAWVVLGLGKLGAREMTATSDLDLIFVYDFVEGALQSDGPRPLAPGPYFARASQKLITALTALTSEGGLYEVDMRLRPSGNKGPVAVSLQTFTSYQADEAWTWERMALTRARVVAGPAGLRLKVEAAMQTALAHPRPRETILSDVAGMRARLQREHAKSGPWDLKQHPGGMVDIEFIAQGLTLCVAQEASHTFHVDGNTRNALLRLREAGALADDDATALIQGAALLDDLTHMVRLTVDGPFVPHEAAPGLKSLLSRVAGRPNLDETEAALRATMHDIRARFERLIGPVS